MEEISLAALPAGAEMDDEYDSDADVSLDSLDTNMFLLDDGLENTKDDVSLKDNNGLNMCCVCQLVDPRKIIIRCSARNWTKHWYHLGCGHVDNVMTPAPFSGRLWCGMCLGDQGKKELAELGIVDLLHVGKAPEEATARSNSRKQAVQGKKSQRIQAQDDGEGGKRPQSGKHRKTAENPGTLTGLLSLLPRVSDTRLDDPIEPVAGGAGASGSDYQAEWDRYLADEENITRSSFPKESSFYLREWKPICLGVWSNQSADAF